MLVGDAQEPRLIGGEDVAGLAPQLSREERPGQVVEGHDRLGNNAPLCLRRRPSNKRGSPRADHRSVKAGADWLTCTGF
jgi:hypothetical protein